MFGTKAATPVVANWCYLLLAGLMAFAAVVAITLVLPMVAPGVQLPRGAGAVMLPAFATGAHWLLCRFARRHAGFTASGRSITTRLRLEDERPRFADEFSLRPHPAVGNLIIACALVALIGYIALFGFFGPAVSSRPVIWPLQFPLWVGAAIAFGSWVRTWRIGRVDAAGIAESRPWIRCVFNPPVPWDQIWECRFVTHRSLGIAQVRPEFLGANGQPVLMRLSDHFLFAPAKDRERFLEILMHAFPIPDPLEQAL